MVERCVCHDVSFSRVAELARSGQTLEQISEQTGCCTGCGTCEPYVRVVIATGRTRLPVMTERQAAEVVAQAEAWERSGGDRDKSAQ
jgi:bacterioferritin-associated ferredoxin